MSTVTRPSSGERAARAACSWSRRGCGAFDQAVVAHEAHEAARAVAALLDLVAAAAVVDAVAEVDARRGGCGRRRGSGRRRRRNAGRRARAAARPSASSGARVSSSTTKSLPAPCILVKRNRMRRLSRAPRGAQYSGASPAGRVLKRLCTHRYCAGLRADLAPRSSGSCARCRPARRRSGSRSTAAGSAPGSPARPAASRPAPAAPPCPAPRHARRREQRRGRHAEERHEGGVALAEVHVGQVEEGGRPGGSRATAAWPSRCAERSRRCPGAGGRAGSRRPSPRCSAPGRSRRPSGSGTAAPRRRRRRAP